MSLLTVKIFQNNVDAHLFKARLESQDIQCYLFDENINSMDMIYGVAVGGIKVKVNSSDTEKVKKVLSDMEEEQRKQSLFIKCPVCKSTEYYKNFISIQGWKAFFCCSCSFYYVFISCLSKNSLQM